MKKILSTTICLLAVISLLLTSCGKKAASDNTTETDTTGAEDTTFEMSTVGAAELSSLDEQLSQAVSNSEPEKATVLQSQLEAAQNQNEEAVAVSGDVGILTSGTFYVTGSIEDADKTTTAMSIATNGSDLYMGTKLMGVDLAILKTADTTYMIYPGQKIYLEMTDTVLKMLGMDSSTLDFDMSSIKSGVGSTNKLGSTTASLDGKDVLCTKFQNDDGSYIWRYTDGTTLLRMEEYDSSMNFTGATNFDTVSPTVPDGILTIPDDYSAKSLTAFMTAIQQNAQE